MSSDLPAEGKRGEASEVRLTPKQRAAFGVLFTEGDLNEGMLAECWPLIRNARLVTNGLLAKGLFTLGPWWDEGVGYELIPTPLGREVLAREFSPEETPAGGSQTTEGEGER